MTGSLDKECNFFFIGRFFFFGFETDTPLYPSPLTITNLALNHQHQQVHSANVGRIWKGAMKGFLRPWLDETGMNPGGCDLLVFTWRRSEKSSWRSSLTYFLVFTWFPGFRVGSATGMSQTSKRDDFLDLASCKLKQALIWRLIWNHTSLSLYWYHVIRALGYFNRTADRVLYM